MANVNLHCYVLGDATDKIFTLNIAPDASVSSLRSLVAQTIQLNPTQFNLFSVPLSRHVEAQRKTRPVLERIDAFFDLIKTEDQQEQYGAKFCWSGRVGAPIDVLSTQLRVVWLKKPAEKVAAVFDLEGQSEDSSSALDLVVALDLASYFHVPEPQQLDSGGSAAPPAYEADDAGPSLPPQDQKLARVEAMPPPSLFLDEPIELSSLGAVEEEKEKPDVGISKRAKRRKRLLLTGSAAALIVALITEISASTLVWMLSGYRVETT
ncbi:hypothetical protein HDU97_008968 [Phlyctochytrium planicorne]|nr:hypothetical protein HDU97_008968 [Phlyctochytrium planicorne]